jgi:hypothetical protein
MALKPDRQRNKYADDMTWFMNEVAEKGGVVVISTVGSGAAMDQSTNLGTYASSPSGKLPLGFLLVDMVNKDLTQTHLNPYNGEVQKGSKVLLSPQGSVVTNMIYPGLTITAGQTCYLGPSGLVQNVYVNDAATPIVGSFLSTKDEDGYAKVRYNLPNTTPRL